jgi:nitrite reductase/ring-hydroxylating ferredoxin subunit
MILDLVGGERSRSASDLLVGVGVLSAIPTAATGLSDWSDTWGETRRVGLVHGLGNTAALLAYGASFVARKRGARTLGVGLGFLGGAIASATAYLGGHLVFGRGVGVDVDVFERAPRDWTAVADEATLEPGVPLRAKAGDAEVVLVRHEGAIRALAQRCTHRGGPLSEGEVEGGTITCPWHGSVFTLVDGSVVRGPATSPQPCYETRVRDGRIEVRLGRDG